MSDSAWEKEAAFWEGYHTARREALEEAAKVAEEFEIVGGEIEHAAREIAAVIRALMEKKDE